jgi:arsenical pump membrane protein
VNELRAAAQQAWPPFVLVTGLLMVGVVAHADGLFDRAGALLARVPGPPIATFVGCLALVAVVTATMNLDTAVVFLTPVLVVVGRGRGLDETPFLYAALFMANASSLFLPGSNLTNLLVLGGQGDGGDFARAMFWPALVATVVTAAGLWLLLARSLPRSGEVTGGEPGDEPAERVGVLGLMATAVAAVLTVVLSDPALPVFVLGLAAATIACLRGELTPGAVVRAIGPAVVLSLFAVSVALGVLARSWDGPAHLLVGAGRWETAGVAAGTAVLINNLPAAVLLSAHHVTHPRALLVGLNLGPNLAVTGSLASYLWWRAAKQVGAEPSIARVSRLGVILAPLAILCAVLTLTMVGGSI